MRNFLNKKVLQLKPSGIRKFFDYAAGRKDIISLGVGEPDFDTPWEVREAGINALKKGLTQYTSNQGLTELREEICRYLAERFNVKASPEQTVITIGASEAIDITLRAVVDDGDEVLIPDPSYVSYKPCVELAGGVAVPVECRGVNGFKLTAESLKKAITPKTKVLIFPYPNNPTGGIMEEEYIKEIIPIIVENDLLVISDEIYAELTYGGSHVSICSFPELADRTVLISGFSKAFAMTGWRIGYVCAPKEISSALLKIHQYTAICAPVFSQYAALSALKNGRVDGYSSVVQMRAEYERRRRFMHKAFCEMGLSCFEPKGSFYIFPSVEKTGLSGEEFAFRLLEEKKVAVVPGGAFGEFGKNYVRCSYAYSMSDLIKATELIAQFVKELLNK